MNVTTDTLYRWALLGIMAGWLTASGCLCYGGGEPPPLDDDTDDSADDDATNNTEFPEYEVDGFYLDIGQDTGDGQYEGIVITEDGSISAWSGLDGAHSDEAWLATLTEGQLDTLIAAIDPEGFFGASIDEAGDPRCAVEFRLGTDANEVFHQAGDVPEALTDLY